MCWRIEFRFDALSFCWVCLAVMKKRCNFVADLLRDMLI